VNCNRTSYATAVLLLIAVAAQSFDAGVTYAGSCETSGNWSSVGGGLAGVDPQVRAITTWVPPGQSTPRLYFAGKFSTDESEEVTLNSIAEWDGTILNALTEDGRDPGIPTGGMNDEVRVLTVYDGVLVAGGQFTIEETMCLPEIHSLAAWDGMKWNTDDYDFGLAPLSSVHAVLPRGASLYVGGNIQLPSDMAAEWQVAVWDGTDWTSLGLPEAFDKVLCLGWYGGELYAGGSVSELKDPKSIFAKWDGDEWVDIGLEAELDFDHVAVMVEFEGSLYVGGWFPNPNCSGTTVLIAWNGSTWTNVPFGTATMSNSTGVSHLHVDGEGCDSLIVSGQFRFTECDDGDCDHTTSDNVHIAYFHGRFGNGDLAVCALPVGGGTSDGGPVCVATIGATGRRIFVGSQGAAD